MNTYKCFDTVTKINVLLCEYKIVFANTEEYNSKKSDLQALGIFL
jgi:hypothetical protein